jgi:hypothetical protein
MQIVQSSVATDANGIVFNCDGQYTLNNTGAGPGQGDVSGVESVYANYSKGSYGAHSQLARVNQAAIGGDPNAPDSSNASFQNLSEELITCFSVDQPPANLDQYYAGGAGELHIYGLDAPLTLYS